MTDCTPYAHLSIEERVLIQLALEKDESSEQIARLLGRSPSTVRREIERNSTTTGYRAPRWHWMEEHPTEARVILDLMAKRRSVAQAVVIAERMLGYALCSAEVISERRAAPLRSLPRSRVAGEATGASISRAVVGAGSGRACSVQAAPSQ